MTKHSETNINKYILFIKLFVNDVDSSFEPLQSWILLHYCVKMYETVESTRFNVIKIESVVE